jgi:hypothetical protein
VYLPMVDAFCEMPLIVVASARLIPNARIAIRCAAKIHIIFFITTYPFVSQKHCQSDKAALSLYLEKGG